MRYRRVHRPGGTFFFTLITYRRRRLFDCAENVERWSDAVEKVRLKRPFEIDAEVVLPDHLHLLWTLPEGDADYSTRIRLVKTVFTKSNPKSTDGRATKVSRSKRNEQAVWQRRYWEHTIRDESDYQAHADYIHINPVRHRLVDRPGDWPYSTFRDWVKQGSYEPHWGTNEIPVLPEWIGKE